MFRAIITITIAAALFTSCTKDNKATSVTIGIPWDEDGLMPTHSLYAPPIIVSGVSGLHLSAHVYGNFVDTAGTDVHYHRYWQFASYNGDIAAAAVNGYALALRPNGSWFRRDTGNVWANSSVNIWSVSGAGGIPSFTADIHGQMPEFNGTFPSVIAATNDFEYTFNTANVANADAAYVVVHFNGKLAISNVVDPKGGTAKIPASQFRAGTSSDPRLTVLRFGLDGRVCNGTLAAVVLVNRSYREHGGVRFAYTQQTVHLLSVTFI
ncbi:MAG: hypothetical protein V4649_09590 [Bacteroidota bacterium]